MQSALDELLAGAKAWPARRHPFVMSEVNDNIRGRNAFLAARRLTWGRRNFLPDWPLAVPPQEGEAFRWGFVDMARLYGDLHRLI